MQQYFIDRSLNTGDIIMLDDDVLHHLIKVLRKDSSYVFRLADKDGKIFHAHLLNKKECEVGEFVDENSELDCDITCIMSLIKSDRFELAIQKLVEIGVKRIVPYESYRSVMKIKDEKKIERFRKIAREAAEQSHRNIIPEITEPVSIKGLKDCMSENNYICYESEKQIIDIRAQGSVTYIIGPEGGFDREEYEKICAMGFESISLGKRILRAETAAIYAGSIIVSKCQ
ncbi:MAG: 16S rRNA (uracil(1498)-N(3))-methyltransferase [Erysipelotrichaceae bacterium]|nr:16S rRNA (uracil(1498)-N(3))-methyltransferase [Erysipelotrichaceae bacterium]